MGRGGNGAGRPPAPPSPPQLNRDGGSLHPACGGAPAHRQLVAASGRPCRNPPSRQPAHRRHPPLPRPLPPPSPPPPPRAAGQVGRQPYGQIGDGRVAGRVVGVAAANAAATVAGEGQQTARQTCTDSTAAGAGWTEPRAHAGRGNKQAGGVWKRASVRIAARWLQLLRCLGCMIASCNSHTCACPHWTTLWRYQPNTSHFLKLHGTIDEELLPCI